MTDLPDALKALGDLAQWVCWDNVNGRKIPRSPHGGNAKANDRSTWGTLDEAIEAADSNGYTGLGIELDGGLVGIDLDGCVHDGQIEPWAQEIVDRIDSYAEISPSGTGIHIICGASPEKTGAIGRANHAKGLEIYNHGRYFTVTGKTINERDVRYATDEVLNLVSEEFPEPSAEDRMKSELGRLAKNQVARRANDTVMHNARRDRKRGVRFARVPMGNHTCAFCTMLASRGFVYWSKETAGAFAHWHADCRCKVVPGVPEIKDYWKNGVHVTRGFDPQVEGYDPDAYFKLYERGIGAGDFNDTAKAPQLDHTKESHSKDRSMVPNGVHAKTGSMTPDEYADYKRELEQTRSLKQIRLSRREYAHVMSELNTHMSEEDRKHAIVTKSIGNYRYTVINMGFNEYRIVGREPIQ